MSWGREGGPRAESLSQEARPPSAGKKRMRNQDTCYQSNSCGWVDRADSYAASAMCRPLSICRPFGDALPVTDGVPTARPAAAAPPGR